VLGYQTPKEALAMYRAIPDVPLQNGQEDR